MPDIVYTRPANRKKYISIAKHQTTALNSYSKWLSINIERNLFDYADYGNFNKTANTNLSWTCQSGNMWSLNQDRSSVGTQKEQFGFFQKPSNLNDEWHGYPVIPFSKNRLNISDSILERWITEGVINVDDVPNIMNKKRI
jgi:hypothetical protein